MLSPQTANLSKKCDCLSTGSEAQPKLLVPMSDLLKIAVGPSKNGIMTGQVALNRLGTR
jgi:hypothetical protein